MSYFRTARNLEISTIKYLKDQIDENWSGVTTIISFTQAYSNTIKLPVVCIRLMDQNTDRLEIGSTTWNHRYNIVIDVFAKSDPQRIDLTDFILETIKDSWVYNTYSHASGTNAEIVATPDGRIMVTAIIENGRVDIGETVESKDRFRQSLIFTVRKDV